MSEFAGAECRQQELAVTLLPSPRVMRGAMDAWRPRKVSEPITAEPPSVA